MNPLSSSTNSSLLAKNLQNLEKPESVSSFETVKLTFTDGTSKFVNGKRFPGDSYRFMVMDEKGNSLFHLKKIPSQKEMLWMTADVVGLKGGGSDYFDSLPEESIAILGNHYISAYGSNGPCYVFSKNDHSEVGTFWFSAHEDGEKLICPSIENDSPVKGCLDIAIYHLCLKSNKKYLEFEAVVNSDLRKKLMETYGMKEENLKCSGNISDLLRISKSNLERYGWHLK